MSDTGNEKISGNPTYVVYSTPGGVSLEIDEVPSGETWTEGAMESYYATFGTYDEARKYVNSFFSGNK